MGCDPPCIWIYVIIPLHYEVLQLLIHLGTPSSAYLHTVYWNVITYLSGLSKMHCLQVYTVSPAYDQKKYWWHLFMRTHPNFKMG